MIQEFKANNLALDIFATLYGYHGCIYDWQSGDLLEVKRLEFDKYDFAETCDAIPQDLKVLYKQALFEDFLVFKVYSDGGYYQVFIGSKRWIKSDELEYQRLSKLKRWIR